MGVYIDYKFLLQTQATNAYWLRVNHTSDLPGFKPQTRKECLHTTGVLNPRHGKSVGSIRTKGGGRKGENSRDVVCLKAL